MQKVDWDFFKRIEAINLDNPNFDVLIIGNSLAMDGIDTKYLSDNGYSSYNLSIAGASILTNYYQLEEYFSHYKMKPKYVIIGLGSFISSFTSREIHPVVDFTKKDKVYTINDIPMIKFKWMFLENFKKIISKSHRNAYLQLGQLKFDKIVPDITKVDPNKKFPLEKYKTSVPLKKIITLCSSNSITLIIVEMPGFKNVRHQKSFDYKILNKKESNGYLFDYNNFDFCKIFNDKKDWVGNSHLNEFGATKFTKRLLQDINMVKYDRASAF